MISTSREPQRPSAALNMSAAVRRRGSCRWLGASGDRGALWSAARERAVLTARDVHQIRVDDALRVALGLGDAAVQPERFVAEARDEIERVGHEQHRPAAAAELGELVEALVRKRFVADGEHFVDEQDVRVDVDRDGETEPHVHAGRIRLHRRVDELLGSPRSGRCRRTAARSRAG